MNWARALRALAVTAGLLGAGLLVARPRRVAVEGRSMEPTLRSGDRLFVAGGRRPGPGDIVALRDPRREGRRLIVKRVVSVDGDRVVVEGDNASASTDSRVFGPVDRRALVGRVLYRYFPPERAGGVGSDRWSDRWSGGGPSGRE